MENKQNWSHQCQWFFSDQPYDTYQVCKNYHLLKYLYNYWQWSWTIISWFWSPISWNTTSISYIWSKDPDPIASGSAEDEEEEEEIATPKRVLVFMSLTLLSLLYFASRGTFKTMSKHWKQLFVLAVEHLFQSCLPGFLIREDFKVKYFIFLLGTWNFFHTFYCDSIHPF